MSEYLDRAFSPAKLGKLELRNRIIKAATFEGRSPKGIPEEAFLEFHKPMADGGIGMNTLAYCATEADGRVNNNMMYMGEHIRKELSHIINTLHFSGSKVSGQMAHCGGFSGNKDLQRKRPLGPSKKLNMLGIPVGYPFVGEMTVSDIDAMVETYYRTALYMKDVGFDAIEIHFGHGYGLSQFFSPLTNRRRDEYGGSLNNRMRLSLRALEAVRKAVGGDFPILGKLSLNDGVRGGTTAEDCVEQAKLLDKAGIDALIISDGTSSHNPMKMFLGESMATGMIEMAQNPIAKLGMKFFLPRLFKEYPYKELYILDGCKQVRDAVSCQMVYIGGCTNTESLEQIMKTGIDFVQLGRALIKDPNFVNNANAANQAGKKYNSECIHCNRCATLINHPDGVRCPEND
jgi:2,4-dienoyl-CoA reductase-like NADH-dependent reductase (Old Yellow Enzyme family)